MIQLIYRRNNLDQVEEMFMSDVISSNLRIHLAIEWARAKMLNGADRVLIVESQSEPVTTLHRFLSV